MICKHNRNGICDIIKKKPEEIGVQCTPFTCSNYASEKKEEIKIMGGTWKPEYGQRRRTKTRTSTEVKARYNRKHYEQMSIVLPIGSKELIRKKAEEQGYASISDYIRHLIAKDAPECLTVPLGGGGGPNNTENII